MTPDAPPRRPTLAPVATGLVLVLLLGLGVAVLAGTSPDPRADQTRVLARYVVLARRGDQAAWSANFRAVRSVDGRGTLPFGVEVLHRPGRHIEASAAALVARNPNGTFDCARTPAGPQCARRPDAPGARLNPVALVAALVERGDVAIAALPPRVVLGARATCFRFDTRSPQWGELAGVQCLDARGVPVWVVRERPGVRDEREAVRVVPGVSRARVEQLLRRFGLTPD